MPGGGLGGIGECAGLDIECAERGGIPTFFMFSAQKIPVNCYLHRVGFGDVKRGHLPSFVFRFQALF